MSDTEDKTQTWEAAQSEADAVRAILDKRAAERTGIEHDVLGCVRELRAAGLPMRAIADELARLGGASEANAAEAEIVAAVVKARAAGLSIRAIVAELAAAGICVGKGSPA